MNKSPIKKTVVVTLIIVGLLIFISFPPRFLERFVFAYSFPSGLTNGEWASFFGSYLGGVLGGLCTLATVVVTVRTNQKQLLKAEEERTKEERKKREEEILSHTLGFISDIEKWNDGRAGNMRRVRPLESQITDHGRVEGRYTHVKNDGYMDVMGKLYTDVDNKLHEVTKKYWEEHFISFCNRPPNEVSTNKWSKPYEAFGAFLENKRMELEHERAGIIREISAERAEKITGNLHYLYLEIICRGDYPELWDAVTELYSKSCNESDESDESDDAVQGAIGNVKKSLKSSLFHSA